MAEEELKKAILEKIRKEKDAILAQAHKECGDIIKQALDQASSLKESHLREFKKRCLAEKASQLSRLSQDAKRNTLKAKEKRQSQVLEEAREGLKSIHRDKNRYRPIFMAFLKEAYKNFAQDEQLELQVNQLDYKLAQDTVKELGLDLEVDSVDSINSGLVILGLQGKKAVLNTFESRLKKAETELRQGISKILFGE